MPDRNLNSCCCIPFPSCCSPVGKGITGKLFSGKQHGLTAEEGGLVDYGRMRLSRRKISKRSLLLFLLLFRIGGGVDLMGFLSSWAEIICPLVFGLSRAEAVILFSALYMSIQQSCFQKGKNPHFWTFPERKDLLFFCLSFPQLKCRHGFAYPVSDAEKSPLTSSSLVTFFRSKQNFR